MELSAPSVGLGVFLATQLGAAVWWASETDLKVEENRTAITTVTQNSRDIAVIQNDIIAIKKMLSDTDENIDEVKDMMRQLLYSYKSASKQEK